MDQMSLILSINSIDLLIKIYNLTWYSFPHTVPVCVPSREMKMEKRSCSGIARVIPSSHMGPLTHTTSTADNKAGLSQVISACLDLTNVSENVLLQMDLVF